MSESEGAKLAKAITDYNDLVNLQECVPVLKRWSEAGEALAQGYFATSLWGGVGVPKDEAAAKAYFADGSLLKKLRAIAEAEGPMRADAALVIGWAYDDGFVGPQDSTEAVVWYRRAAEAGLARGHVEISRCLQLGTGVEADADGAFRHAKIAADSNCAAGIFQLGNYYMTGTGVAADPAKCAEYSRKSAALNCSAGQFGLGLCFEQGIGVDKDEAQAIHYYRLASEQDFHFATDALKRMQDGK